MSQQNQHIIEKQIFQLQVASQKGSFERQQEISKLFWEVLSPEIEKVFDRFSEANKVMLLKKIELDLGIITPEQLKDVLVQKLVFALEEALNKEIISNPKNVEIITLKQRQFDQWIYFLKMGIMPVQSITFEDAVFQTAILETLGTNRQAVLQLQEVLQQYPQSFRRFVLQHSTSFFEKVTTLFSGIPQTELVSMLAVLDKVWRPANFTKKDLIPLNIPPLYSTSVQPYFWAYIFKKSIFEQKKYSPATWIQQLLLLILKNKTEAKLLPILKKEIAKDVQQQRFFEPIIKRVEKIIITSTETLSPEIETTKTLETTNFIESDKPAIDDTATVLNTAEKLSTSSPQSDEVSQKKQTETHFKSNKSEEKKVISKNKKSTENLIQQPQKENTNKPETSHSETAFDTPKQDKNPAKTNKDVTSFPESDSSKTSSRTGDFVQNLAASEQQSTKNPDAPPNKEKSTERQNQTETQKSKFESPNSEKEMISNEPQKAPKLSPTTTQKAPPEPKVGNSFYIKNAGLVLIHAFLTHLFKHLKLVEDKTFIDEKAREKAVHLIHYLATGETQAPEYELLLAKLLCQIPFHQAIARDILLTAAEKEEANNLLKAAIKHWNKLGNASPDALREGFFQRDGKLTKKEQGWYLQVEKKSLDVLLDFLPWSISMIRLPWMKELLRVEWGK